MPRAVPRGSRRQSTGWQATMATIQPPLRALKQTPAGHGCQNGTAQNEDPGEAQKSGEEPHLRQGSVNPCIHGAAMRSGKDGMKNRHSNHAEEQRYSGIYQPQDAEHSDLAGVGRHYKLKTGHGRQLRRHRCKGCTWADDLPLFQRLGHIHLQTACCLAPSSNIAYVAEGQVVPAGFQRADRRPRPEPRYLLAAGSFTQRSSWRLSSRR